MDLSVIVSRAAVFSPCTENVDPVAVLEWAIQTGGISIPPPLEAALGGRKSGPVQAMTTAPTSATAPAPAWAHSLPLPPAMAPLPGAAPLPIATVRADTQGTTRSTAPEVAESALGDVEQTSDPERRLALLRALGGSAKYAGGEWKFKGTGALVAREKADSRRRSDEKTIRADLKEGAQAEREAKAAGVFNGLGQR